MRMALLAGLLLACGGKDDGAVVLPPDTGGGSGTTSCDKETGRVTGRVVTFVGQALLNAEVTFVSEDEEVEAELSNEGYFDEDLRAGSWVMNVVNSGCADGMKLLEVAACSDEEHVVELDCG